MSAKPETKIVSGLLKAIRQIPGVKAWRNNTGFFMFDARPLRFGEKGSADIMGIIAPTGRMFCLECKSAKGALTDHQDEWLAMMRRLGARTAVVRDVGVGISILADWIEEEKHVSSNDEGSAQLQSRSAQACR